MFNYLLTLSGSNFYPSKLNSISKLKVTIRKDVGEINNIGRKIELGYICIEGESIEELNLIALEVKAETTAISEIEFSVIRYYDDQCNLEFSSEELNMISNLNAHLSISCSKNS